MASSSKPYSPITRHRTTTPTPQAEFSKKLFRSSFLTLSSIFGAFYFGQHDCCALAVAVFCASLNYWRHAVKV